MELTPEEKKMEIESFVECIVRKPLLKEADENEIVFEQFGQAMNKHIPRHPLERHIFRDSSI